MRTNLVLNDALVKEALMYAHVSSKRALVDLALREFVENHRKLDVRDLRGKIQFNAEYDYKALRNTGDKP
jgi:Arc/MetJ family transcription regulator